MTVGVFAVTQLSVGRWRVTNSLTSFTHVTYGTESEVVEQLELQSRAWKDRLDPTTKKRGSAWRQKNRAEFAQSQVTKNAV